MRLVCDPPSLMRAATPGRLAALMRLQRNALTTVLVIGGSARQRLETGLAFHRRSFLRRGPFVARDAVHDAHGLGRAFAARVNGVTATDDPLADDALSAAEGGTLFVDRVESLDVNAQRWIRGLLDRVTLPCFADPVWAGRLVFGASRDPRAEVSAGRFLPDLLDAIDKVRVELSLVAEERR